MKALKVYGWIDSRRTELPGTQVRLIVAAHSVADALRKTRTLRSTWSWSGCETKNPDEVKQALSHPERFHYRGVNDRGDGPWSYAPIYEKEDPTDG